MSCIKREYRFKPLPAPWESTSLITKRFFCASRTSDRWVNEIRDSIVNLVTLNPSEFKLSLSIWSWAKSGQSTSRTTASRIPNTIACKATWRSTFWTSIFPSGSTRWSSWPAWPIRLSFSDWRKVPRKAKVCSSAWTLAPTERRTATTSDSSSPLLSNFAFRWTKLRTPKQA